MEQEKKKLNLKIIIPIVIVIILVFVGSKFLLNNDTNTNSNEYKEGNILNEKTNYMSIDGIYVDNSYKDKENESLKLVYLFYTVNSNDKNLRVHSKSTKITINDMNTYSATGTLDKVCLYMSNYYYSDYIEDVYIGDTIKVVETFKIPQGDLIAGKSIKLKNSEIPETEKIYLLTDNIIYCDNDKQIAEKIDPQGYEKELNKREKASNDVVKKVKNAINGYQWNFYVNYTSYEIEFGNSNKFEVRTAFGSNGGKYEIKNGYIFCMYDSNNYTVEIPYSWKDNGSIELDVVSAFDVKQ